MFFYLWRCLEMGPLATCKNYYAKGSWTSKAPQGLMNENWENCVRFFLLIFAMVLLLYLSSYRNTRTMRVQWSKWGHKDMGPWGLFSVHLSFHYHWIISFLSFLFCFKNWIISFLNKSKSSFVVSVMCSCYGVPYLSRATCDRSWSGNEIHLAVIFKQLHCGTYYKDCRVLMIGNSWQENMFN